MADFRNFVITNEGTSLVNQQMAGERTLTFTKIKIGVGIYTQAEIADLVNRTALKSELEEYSLTSKESVNNTSIKMTATITNTSMTVQESITEIGLYASDGTNEILYSITVANDPLRLPAYDGSAAYSASLEIYAAVSSDLTITITDRSDIATTTIAGVVKASEDIVVAADGTMSINQGIKTQINKSTSDIDSIKPCVTANMLNPTLQSTTLYGVQFTRTNDNTYLLNGTASIEFSIDVLPERLYDDCTYRLCGCPEGGNGNYSLSFRIIGSDNINDTGNGVTANLNGITASIGIVIRQNVTFNNTKFKPMLTTNLSATYNDFVPYTGKNKKINADVADLQKDVDKLNRDVASNLFNASNVYNSSDFTITDGVVSGTNTSFQLTKKYMPSDCIGKELTFSASLKNGNGVTYVCVLAVVNGTSISGNRASNTNDFEKSKVTFTPQSTNDFVRISYGDGSGTVNAKEIMLSQYDVDFVPYTGDNGAINKDVANIRESVTEIERTTNKRKYIFVTDSYGSNDSNALNYTGKTWIDFCCDYLGIAKASPNVYSIANPGAGFTIANNSFLQAITSLASTVTNKLEITDIVVCGGCNDCYAISTTIFTAVQAFKTYCNTYYPNARIHLGHIGWFTDSALFWYSGNAVNSYIYCRKFGIHYLGNVEYIMHYYGYFGSGHHPNLDGSEAIGCGVGQALLYGSCDVSYMTNPVFTLANNIASTDCTLVAMSQLSNGSAMLSFAFQSGSTNKTEITFNMTQGGIDFTFGKDRGFLLGTINKNTCMWGDAFNRAVCPVKTIMIDQTHGTAYEMSAIATLSSGNIYISLDSPTSQDTSRVIHIDFFRLTIPTFAMPTICG